jgi:hypothetical protein
VRSSRPVPRAILALLAAAVAAGRSAAPPVSAVSPLVETALAAQAAVAERGVSRSRTVTIDLAAFPRPTSGRTLAQEPPLLLELFPDTVVRAIFDRYDPNATGVTWVGHVEGVATSSVTLVYRDDVLFGNVAAAGRVFSIRPTAGTPPPVDPSSGRRLHTVAELDPAAFPREGRAVEAALPAGQTAAVIGAPADDAPPTIDLLVVYTTLIAATAGPPADVNALLDVAVAETNTSYINSHISQRVRLVHVQEVPYVEGNQFGLSLSDLQAGRNGLSGVAALRNQYGADIVTLLVRAQQGDACGIGFLMTSISATFSPAAYNVVDAACLSLYTLPHELGHNMGARHDWYVDSGLTPFSYAHGYVNPAPGQRWRTVMAYADLCTAQGFGCPRVLYWSSPSVQYQPYCSSNLFDCGKLKYWYFPGSPMGVASGTNSSCRIGSTQSIACDADNARVLNATATTVAAFRPTVVGPAER